MGAKPAHNGHPSICWQRSIVPTRSCSAPLTPLSTALSVRLQMSQWLTARWRGRNTVHTFWRLNMESCVPCMLAVCFFFFWQLCWFLLQIRSLRCYHWPWTLDHALMPQKRVSFTLCQLNLSHAAIQSKNKHSITLCILINIQCKNKQTK